MDQFTIRWCLTGIVAGICLLLIAFHAHCQILRANGKTETEAVGEARIRRLLTGECCCFFLGGSTIKMLAASL